MMNWKTTLSEVIGELEELAATVSNPGGLPPEDQKTIAERLTAQAGALRELGLERTATDAGRTPLSKGTTIEMAPTSGFDPAAGFVGNTLGEPAVGDPEQWATRVKSGEASASKGAEAVIAEHDAPLEPTAPSAPGADTDRDDRWREVVEADKLGEPVERHREPGDPAFVPPVKSDEIASVGVMTSDALREVTHGPYTPPPLDERK